MYRLLSRKFIISVLIICGTFIVLVLDKINAEQAITVITGVLAIYSAYNHSGKTMPAKEDNINEQDNKG